MSDSPRGHARQRLEERYGIKVSDEDWPGVVADIINDIRGGRALFTSRPPLDNGQGQGEVWLVYVRGMAVRVLYNPVAFKLITVFPPSSRKRPAKGFTPKKLRADRSHKAEPPRS